jgi:hypothetical protein
MGLQTSDTTRKTFLNIINGQFAVKVTKETEGAVARTNKKGETVYEMLYQKLFEVMITEMKIEKNDFGKQLAVTLQDGADNFTLNVPVDSKYFDSWCAKIGNVDLMQTRFISPGSYSSMIGLNPPSNG